jgi:uncharacterized protein YecE (DUF72 family)
MLRVGTSGWHYADWRGAFYPKGVPQRSWLRYYAEQFPTVELNNSFYRLPDVSGFRRWKEQTPDGFVFTVKASRFLTHYRRLRDPEEPVERLLAAAAGLGEKLGPVLLQLPPDMAVECERLEQTLEAFAGRVQLACEFRHGSWFCDEVYDVLRARDVALCLTDRRNRHGPLVRTASWVFVRMHEGTAAPHPSYGTRALHTWTDRIAELWGTGADGYVYFNNDHFGCAVRNAAEFAAIGERAGLDAIPGPRSGQCGGAAARA